MKYKVDIEYLVPEFAEIEIDSDRADLVGLEAMQIFKEEFPEAVDPTVVKVHN